MLTAMQKIEMLESRLLSNPLHNSPRLPALYDQYAEKMQLSGQAKSLKKKINDAISTILLDELKCRRRVLRRFGFISETDVVQLKARVACEISTADELLLSELLFNRFFNELSPELCAAVLSVFIFDEKDKTKREVREELDKPYREVLRQARVVAKVAQESKLALNEEEYLNTFNPQLMDVVYAWAHGKPFAEIWCVSCFPSS